MVETVQQNIAFRLAALDYNGEGDEITITWSDLEKAEVGQRWIANSGNMLRDCCTYDELEVVYKSDTYIICLHTWETIGGYPDYPVNRHARLIFFVMDPDIKIEEELIKIRSKEV